MLPSAFYPPLRAQLNLDIQLGETEEPLGLGHCNCELYTWAVQGTEFHLTDGTRPLNRESLEINVSVSKLVNNIPFGVRTVMIWK